MGQLDDPAGPKSAAYELRVTERADLDPLLLEPYIAGPSTPRHRKQDGAAPTSVLRETWREARGDIRAIRWGRGGLWFLFICWIMGLLMCMIVMPSIWTNNDISSACLPDGTFSIFAQYDPWNIYGFFQITSGFGELTFTQAKVVDVIWDVVSYP